MARNDELRLNQNPFNQAGDLAGRLAQTPVVLKYAVTADATSALSITVPYDMEIYDVVVVCTTANASGTLTLRSGTNAITDAITCAVDKAVDRAATIDDAYASITTSTSLNVISNGAADRGILYIHGIRE